MNIPVWKSQDTNRNTNSNSSTKLLWIINHKLYSLVLLYLCFGHLQNASLLICHSDRTPHHCLTQPYTTTLYFCHSWDIGVSQKRKNYFMKSTSLHILNLTCRPLYFREFLLHTILGKGFRTKSQPASLTCLKTKESCPKFKKQDLDHNLLQNIKHFNSFPSSSDFVKSKYLELHSSRYHDGPEGEWVRADGCDHDGWNVGMDHGSSGCHCVRSTSCRCWYYYTWGQKRHTCTNFTLWFRMLM